MGRRTLVLVVALLLAAIATFAVYNFLSGVEEEAAKDRTYQTVYRSAIEGLPEGTTGAAVLDQLRYVESEEEARLVPENVIDSLEELRATLDGRVAAGPISGNQVLTTDQWVEITTEIDPLATRIAEGKEAITVFAELDRGVFGFIEPGDRINVIVSMELDIEVPVGEELVIGEVVPEDEATTDPLPQSTTITKSFTRYTLQGIPVLAVGDEVKADEGAPVEIVAPQSTADGEAVIEEETATTVVLTLEVSPDQAEKLVFGYEFGSVWLTLVPDTFIATDERPTLGVTVEALYGPDFGYLNRVFPFLDDLTELLTQEQ